MISRSSRAKMLMILIVTLSLTSAILPALFISPQIPGVISVQNPPPDSSGLHGTRGHAVLVGTVDTRDLPATTDQMSSKGLAFYSPSGAGGPSSSRPAPQVLATTSSSAIGVSSGFDGINSTQANCGCT